MKPPVPVFLALAVAGVATAAPAVSEDADRITITRDGTVVLSYWKTEILAPPGTNPLNRRSGFIHPLCAPSGEPLTSIQPADHPHHLGVFHAWTLTSHRNTSPDFWNLGTGTGRVRYAATVSTDASADEAGFAVMQEHVAYRSGVAETVLSEILEVSARFAEGRNLISYRVTQTNITNATLFLPANRYGGCFGWRGPASWNAGNGILLTSEGKNRNNSHTTRAKWITFTGPTASGQSSFAVLINPANHDFPQRLRTWSSQIENGAPFLSIAPTQETAWQILPGETIRMDHVIVTADAVIPAAELDELWDGYAIATADEAYEVWAVENFDAADLDDEDISGPDGDPDHDGTANRLEFILGTSPHSALAQDAIETFLMDSGGLSFPAIRFRQSQPSQGMPVFPSTSDDLAGWSGDPLVLPEIGRTSDARFIYRVHRHRDPLDGTSPRRFFRLATGE